MRIKFIQKLIDKLRNKKKAKNYTDTEAYAKICADNNIQINEKDLNKVFLDLKGTGNTIIVEDSRMGDNSRVHIRLFGDNNTVIIKKGFFINSNLMIEIGRNHPNFGKVYDACVSIGEETSIESATFVILNSKGSIEIGKNCMFANDVTIYNTDSHPIFDINTNEIINSNCRVKIGEHCWLGRNCTILRNTEIANNCIVGWGSVAKGRFLEENCAIAGNSARVVKRGVNWAVCHPEYVNGKYLPPPPRRKS